MAKKKITAQKVIDLYMDYVLEHGEDPKSVYTFAKANNFDEQLFYVHFASFDGVNQAVFTQLFRRTIALIEQSEGYESFDAQDQLLSFYFTFFENLTANRSYVVYELDQNKNKLESLKVLRGLRKEFKSYIAALPIETLDIKQKDLRKLQDNALQEAAWTQLLLTIQFWLKDRSLYFEKTDIFIEKSVKASFDILNIAPIKSVVDLGKFLWKETQL